MDIPTRVVAMEQDPGLHKASTKCLAHFVTVPAKSLLFAIEMALDLLLPWLRYLNV